MARKLLLRVLSGRVVLSLVGVGGVAGALSLEHQPTLAKLCGLGAVAVLSLAWIFAGIPKQLLVWGCILNFLVIAINGGMPVSPEIAAATGRVFRPDLLHVSTEGARLPWLGDVIPVPVLRQVISVGDALLMLGAVSAPFAIALRRRSSVPATQDGEKSSLRRVVGRTWD